MRVRKKLGVDRRVAVAHEHAHRNGRAGRVEAAPDEVAPRIEHLDLVSRDGAPFDAQDRLLVHPRVAGPHGLDVTRASG